MNNTQQAQLNMIKQQVRTWDMTNDAVLDALYQVPREKFVPAAYQALAFADVEIPLTHGVMLPPKIIAKALQALELKPTDRALEIGTGSGYGSALLGLLTKRVFSLDHHAECGKAALATLKSLQIHNVSFETGDLLQGLKTHGPYDIIMVNGSLPQAPESLKSQLSIGGRMCVFVGETSDMHAILIKRINETEWSQHNVFETVVPRLENVTERNRFVF